MMPFVSRRRYDALRHAYDHNIEEIGKEHTLASATIERLMERGREQDETIRQLRMQLTTAERRLNGVYNFVREFHT